jgi:hypothetical protein
LDFSAPALTGLELSLELLTPESGSAIAPEFVPALQSPEPSPTVDVQRPEPSPAVVVKRPEPEPWADGDPWAEAVVEAHQAAALAPRAHLSPYPLVMNDQVRFFLERFTGERRDVVDLWMNRAGRYLGMIRRPP